MRLHEWVSATHNWREQRHVAMSSCPYDGLQVQYPSRGAIPAV
jgi:hypothetical protein